MEHDIGDVPSLAWRRTRPSLVVEIDEEVPHLEVLRLEGVEHLLHAVSPRRLSTNAPSHSSLNRSRSSAG
jgi:hypothetical protein